MTHVDEGIIIERRGVEIEFYVLLMFLMILDFSLMTSHMSIGPAEAVAVGDAAQFNVVVSATSPFSTSPPPVVVVVHCRSQTEGDPRSHLTSSTIHVTRSATLRTTFSEIDTTSSYLLIKNLNNSVIHFISFEDCVQFNQNDKLVER